MVWYIALWAGIKVILEDMLCLYRRFVIFEITSQGANLWCITLKSHDGNRYLLLLSVIIGF